MWPNIDNGRSNARDLNSVFMFDQLPLRWLVVLKIINRKTDLQHSDYFFIIRIVIIATLSLTYRGDKLCHKATLSEKR